LDWSEEYGSVGAVVGATAPAELKSIVELFRDRPLPLLIPGVGGQGGSADTVRNILVGAGYPEELVRVNVSSGALFPWRAGGTAPENWRSAVAEAVRRHYRSLRFRGRGPV
jgi:orotidine-5'-phosphate decarboxylase